MVLLWCTMYLVSSLHMSITNNTFPTLTRYWYLALFSRHHYCLWYSISFWRNKVLLIFNMDCYYGNWLLCDIQIHLCHDKSWFLFSLKSHLLYGYAVIYYSGVLYPYKWTIPQCVMVLKLIFIIAKSFYNCFNILWNVKTIVEQLKNL